MVDDRGRIWLSGRIKDEINRPGFKVQPAEIDALLEGHPAVAEACVFGMADPMSGEAVAAAIRLASGTTANSESLQAWCRERVRREAVPERWYFVADIPRTPRGKVSRDSVRRMLAKDTTTDAFKPGLTEPAHGEKARSDAADTRAILAAVEQAWTEVLDHHSFAASIPWDEAGGDSLDALRLWCRIEEILGSRLPLEAFEPGCKFARNNDPLRGDFASNSDPS